MASQVMGARGLEASFPLCFLPFPIPSAALGSRVSAGGSALALGAPPAFRPCPGLSPSALGRWPPASLSLASRPGPASLLFGLWPLASLPLLVRRSPVAACGGAVAVGLAVAVLPPLASLPLSPHLDGRGRERRRGPPGTKGNDTAGRGAGGHQQDGAAGNEPGPTAEDVREQTGSREAEGGRPEAGGAEAAGRRPGRTDGVWAGRIMWLSSEEPPFSLTGRDATSVTSGSSVVSM